VRGGEAAELRTTRASQQRRRQQRRHKPSTSSCTACMQAQSSRSLVRVSTRCGCKCDKTRWQAQISYDSRPWRAFCGHTRQSTPWDLRCGWLCVKPQLVRDPPPPSPPLPFGFLARFCFRSKQKTSPKTMKQDLRHSHHCAPWVSFPWSSWPLPAVVLVCLTGR
jgi:hypothetical protein